MRTAINKATPRLASQREGYSLAGVLVSITVLGILATLAKPSVDVMFARGRMAEAKTNLAFMQRFQHNVWIYDGNSNGKYGNFNATGYLGNGNYNCNINGNRVEAALTNGCQSLRYNYIATVNAKNFEIVAHAPSDAGEHYVFSGCTGAGTTIYNHNTGDVWAVKNVGNPAHCRNILHFCPTVGKSTNSCGTQLVSGTPQRINIP